MILTDCTKKELLWIIHTMDADRALSAQDCLKIMESEGQTEEQKIKSLRGKAAELRREYEQTANEYRGKRLKDIPGNVYAHCFRILQLAGQYEDQANRLERERD